MEDAQASMGSPPPNEDPNKSIITKADLLERAVHLVSLLSQENKKLRQMIPPLTMTPAMMYQSQLMNSQMLNYPGQMMMMPPTSSPYGSQYGTYPHMSQQTAPQPGPPMNLQTQQKSLNMMEYPQNMANMAGWMMQPNGMLVDSLGHSQSYHWSGYPESAAIPPAKKKKSTEDYEKCGAPAKQGVIPDNMKADSELNAGLKPLKSTYAPCA